MCNVLIWARPSNVNLKDRERTAQPERGDVVDVHDDDNFHWGRTPEFSDEFQIVIVPNARIADFGALRENNFHLVAEHSLAWRHRIWTVDMKIIGANQLNLPHARWVVDAETFRRAISMKAEAATHDNRGRILTTIG